jgi:hypothetical protein
MAMAPAGFDLPRSVLRHGSHVVPKVSGVDESDAVLLFHSGDLVKMGIAWTEFW